MSLADVQRVFDEVAREQLEAGDRDSSRPLDCLTIPTARTGGPYYFIRIRVFQHAVQESAQTTGGEHDHDLGLR